MGLLPEVAQTVAAVRAKKPLVHHLTNYVTANDSANITLAFGASPVMASAPDDAIAMVAMAAALVLNIGTLSADAVDTMVAVGRRAGELGVPVVFDPVGAGGTAMRTAAAQRIIREVPLAVVRGNAAEIAALAGRKAAIRGVDAAGGDADSAAIAAGLTKELGCVVAVTGPVDTVAAAGRTCSIANGHPWLANVTGTGCMATSLIGCCCGAAADPYVAAVAGLTAMGVAGELAHRALQPGEGIGTFRVKLFDAIFAMTPELMLRYGQIG